MEFPDHPFWDWSLDAYGRPGMQEIFLDLQDRLGLDVNLLLFACWTGDTGRGRLSGATWVRLIDGTADWRGNVVAPLRAVRRHLEGDGGIAGAAALRGKVKSLELAAEHAAQLALAGLAGERREYGIPVAQRIADARANLETYLDAAGIAPSRAGPTFLDFLARGCCAGPQTEGP